MTTIAEALMRAVACHQAGQLVQAEQLYRAILQAEPRQVDSLHLCGVIAFQTGRPEQAVEYYREALRHNPNHAEAHSNLSIVLTEQGRLDEAIAHSRRAIELKPGYAEAHNNLGHALHEQGKLEEAARCCREAIRLKAELAEAHYNLGKALKEMGRPEEAVPAYREAIRLQPDFAKAHFNLGLACLRLGNFEEGWRGYEWRWPGHGLTPPPWMNRDAAWDGSALGGRTIFIFGEQGLGDTLEFIRYAPLVKERGGRVIVGCQAPLVRLLQGCPGIDQVVPISSAAPSFDVYAPLMSLPRIFGTTLATIPAAVPYLCADAQLTEKWRRRLDCVAGFKVGINWRGRSSNPSERLRCIPLTCFEPLTRVPGVQLIRLQKDHGSEDLDGVPWRSAVLDLGELDGASGPFMDTAAVMKNLDLVITSDTVIPHLAGGLGVPVWVALPFVADWRWIVGRDDCPWYPTMRLFCRGEADAWKAVFERIAGELAKKAR